MCWCVIFSNADSKTEPKYCNKRCSIYYKTRVPDPPALSYILQPANSDLDLLLNCTLAVPLSNVETYFYCCPGASPLRSSIVLLLIFFFDRELPPWECCHVGCFVSFRGLICSLENLALLRSVWFLVVGLKRAKSVCSDVGLIFLLLLSLLYNTLK